MLAALGVDLGISPVTAGRALAEVGIAFLFAPALHPAMREVMPIRRALGVRTVFNLLGPLTNPAGAKRQVMGVFAAKWVEPCALVLAELGAEHALVVHGVDGLDEITTTAPTQVAEVRGGKVEMRWITPEDLGVARARPEDLAGGAPEDNAQMMLDVLGGAGGPLGTSWPSTRGRRCWWRARSRACARVTGRRRSCSPRSWFGRARSASNT